MVLDRDLGFSRGHQSDDGDEDENDEEEVKDNKDDNEEAEEDDMEEDKDNYQTIKCLISTHGSGHTGSKEYKILGV